MVRYLSIFWLKGETWGDGWTCFSSFSESGVVIGEDYIVMNVQPLPVLRCKVYADAGSL